MGPMERIVPIYDSLKAEKDKAEKIAIGGMLADLVACILSGFAALVALGYSILFFTRFLENDTHLWGIISAFILCFGVGAFAYVPAGITSVIAWRAYKLGPTKKRLLWALFLILPWFVLAFILVFVSDMPKIYSLFTMTLACILLSWSLISLKSWKVQ